MRAVKGIYDGKVVHPLEPVTASPNTDVVVVFAEENVEPASGNDVMQFFGRLKECPVFQGDAVDMQRRWRDEWA